MSMGYGSGRVGLESGFLLRLYNTPPTHARSPTASPAVTQCLLRRGGLGPTVGGILW